jgi:hypothetical protein
MQAKIIAHVVLSSILPQWNISASETRSFGNLISWFPAWSFRLNSFADHQP